MNSLSSDLIPSLNEIVVDMDKLFNHPLFYLIHVDLNDNISLVKPFGNTEIQKDIQRNGYRCISHVWGTADKTIDYVWKKGGEDDECGKYYHRINGITWDVETREEKRERLLQIFKSHKGYFWMDNLCIDQEADAKDKPLEIMGDIYRKCKECVCMLDTICIVDGFDSERELIAIIAKDTKEMIGDEIRDKYGDFQDPTNGDIDKLENKYLMYLASMGRSDWFGRVWTWQEAELPPKLLFCSEQAGNYRYDPFDDEFFRKQFPFKDTERVINNGEDLSVAYRGGEASHEVGSVLMCFTNIMRLDNGDHSIWNNVRMAADSTRRCTSEVDFVYGIMGILNLDIPNGLILENAMVELEKSLQKQGIFVGEGCSRSYFVPPDFDILANLYKDRRLIDGIVVLGRVENVGLGPNVIVLGHDNHGKILSKEFYVHDDEKYKHVCYKYKTDKVTIFLETDNYSINDILETTKIGRKECTFECRGYGHKMNEIFKIMGSRVEIVGHIGDEQDT
jgi:hypothetical protein